MELLLGGSEDQGPGCSSPTEQQQQIWGFVDLLSLPAGHQSVLP